MKLDASQRKLGLACAGLAGAVVLLAAWPAAKIPVIGTPAAVSAPEEPAAPPATFRAAEGLDALRNRPPFLPDRRFGGAEPVAVPAPSLPPPPPPPPPPGSELALVGTVEGPAARLAMIRIKSSGKVERHAEGDAVGSWQLVHVLADRVILRREGVEQPLGFPAGADRKHGPSPSAPSPSAPPAFAPVPIFPMNAARQVPR